MRVLPPLRRLAASWHLCASRLEAPRRLPRSSAKGSSSDPSQSDVVHAVVVLSHPGKDFPSQSGERKNGTRVDDHVSTDSTSIVIRALEIHRTRTEKCGKRRRKKRESRERKRRNDCSTCNESRRSGRFKSAQRTPPRESDDRNEEEEEEDTAAAGKILRTREQKAKKGGNERRTADDDHPVEDIETNIRARGESVRGRTIFEIARVCRRRDCARDGVSVRAEKRGERGRGVSGVSKYCTVAY